MIDNGLNHTDLAKMFHNKISYCSVYTITRLLKGGTLPSENMITHTNALIPASDLAKVYDINLFEYPIHVGKEKFNEKFGTLAGGLLSVALLVLFAVIRKFTNITDAIIISTNIPITGCIIGFGMAKFVNNLIKNHQLNNRDFSEYWEISKYKQR